MSPTKFCFALFVVLNLHHGNPISPRNDVTLGIWPNATVKYIESNAILEWERRRVHGIFALIERISCIRFVPVSEEVKDHLFIKSEFESSHSEMGYQGKRQILSISSKPDLPISEIAYNIMRSLGFSKAALSEPLLVINSDKEANFTKPNISKINLLYKCHTKEETGGPWPNATVNMRISKAFAPSDNTKVTNMIELIEEVSCVRFEDVHVLHNKRLYIKPVYDKSVSELGYTGKRQELGILEKSAGGLEEIAYHFLRTLGVDDGFMKKPLVILDGNKKAKISEENVARLNLLYEC